jgi:hypothetical protein
VYVVQAKRLSLNLNKLPPRSGAGHRRLGKWLLHGAGLLTQKISAEKIIVRKQYGGSAFSANFNLQTALTPLHLLCLLLHLLPKKAAKTSSKPLFLSRTDLLQKLRPRTGKCLTSLRWAASR